MEFDKIKNQEIAIGKKDIGKGRKITTILSRKTLQHINDSPDHAEAMNYERVKKYVKKNFTDLVEANKFYQINILTAEGWRTSEAFENKIKDRNFYDPDKYYKDGDNLTEIYGLQIIQF